MITEIFLLTCISSVFASGRIGIVKQTSVRTNTSFISSATANCIDCLCDCLVGTRQVNSTSSKCYGINCFPSNRSCQHIQQPWIQETDITVDSTSSQFIITKNINFCSCYSAQNIIDKLQNVTPIAVTHPQARYVAYNPYDDTIIVLGNTLIGHFYVSNLTLFQSLAVTDVPLTMCIDSKNIYIIYSNNRSVNKYDMNLKFLVSVSAPINSSSSHLYGSALWKDILFVTDDTLSLIWSLNLTIMSMSRYLDLTSHGIHPFNIAIFNDCLYITEMSSSSIYIYNLVSLSMQTMTFPGSTPLYRLQMDPFCNRLWFGTNTTTYTSVPVFNLGTNTAYLYQAKGSLAQSKTYEVEFDSSYDMYTVAKNLDYFYKYPMSPITCDKN